MNKNLMCIILAAILLFTGSAFADTSIFVATDRHAKYETVNDPVEGNDSLPGNTSAGELPHKNDRRPPKKQMPAYDPDGNLVWHNHLTEVLSLVSADGITPEIVLLGGDNVGDGGDKFTDVTGYPIGAPYFSMTSIDAQVKYVFGDAAKALYTYKDYSKKVDNGEVSSEEYLEFSNSTVVDLGMFYAIKGDLTDLPDITKDGEVIELGSVDGYNSYYVIQFDADAHSNWDEEYLEEAEMLSDKIVEMLKQAEYFKPVDPAAVLIGKKLTFKAEDLDHNWHTSEELFSQNRFTLVNVWGSWCGPCKSELEDLGEFHRQIEDKNCGVLGLEHEFEEYEEFAQEAKDLLKENNITYPNVLVNDDMDSIKAFSSHPSFFFVNSEGVVVSPAFTGAVHVFDKFMPELDKLLAEEGSA